MNERNWRGLQLRISKIDKQSSTISICNQKFVVNPSCFLNTGDKLTVKTDLRIIIGITSQTCKNCPHNFNCPSYDPNLSIIPVVEKAQL